MAPAADSTSSTRAGAERRGATAEGGVLVGRIVGAHGLHGELRVRVEGDLENLLHVPTVWLVREGKEERIEEYEVARVRAGRAGECRLGLHGISDRDAAEAWHGAGLHARVADLPELSPGEFFAYELVGCEVCRLDGSPVGRVREIWETGGRDLLVIEDAAGRDQLVPAVEPLIQQVDLERRRILIDAPPGLLEPVATAETGEASEEQE